MNAFRSLWSAIRLRHWSVTSDDVIRRARKRRPNVSMVSASSGTISGVIEVGVTQRPDGARERFEERLQLGQASTFGVADGPCQPFVRCHTSFFAEIATPSRSGTIAVIK